MSYQQPMNADRSLLQSNLKGKKFWKLGAAVVKLINFKAGWHDVTRVIIDNYSVEDPMKDATRQKRRG